MTESVDTNDISSFEDVLSGVFDLLDSDEQQFIYLTGAAGTGKTTLIEKVLEENSLKKIVVAPTGVAALNIGGTVLPQHGWLCCRRHHITQCLQCIHNLFKQQIGRAHV